MSVVILTIIVFNLKSFKGEKFENNPIRTHNYIFSLMNTKTASQAWPFYDPFSPGELKIEKEPSD